MTDVSTTDEGGKSTDRSMVCVVDSDPVLALMDYRMPGRDGVRAAKFAQILSPAVTS